MKNDIILYNLKKIRLNVLIWSNIALWLIDAAEREKTGVQVQNRKKKPAGAIQRGSGVGSAYNTTIP